MLLGAGDTHHPDGLVHGERHAPDGRLMHGPVVLVCPGAVREQSRDARLHLTACVVMVPPCHRRDPLRELVRSLGQVLADIVENLPTVMTARPDPRGRGVRRLDGVPDVLAISFGNFCEQRPGRTQDLSAVALVGADLCAADEELVGAVDGREVGWRNPDCGMRN